jgi:hypothetical protein
MKKGIFWKVIACLVVLWAFLFLWMCQWHYVSRPGGELLFVIVKTSRLTGRVYIFSKGNWIYWTPSKQKDSDE